MRRKPAKSPTSTQTGTQPPLPRTPSSFPFSNSVFRAYFLAATSQPDEVFDRSVLSPHYLLDQEVKPPVPVAISVPRTIPELQSDTGTKKREVVFTSQGETKGGELLRKKLVKPRTAMSQSRLGERKGNREGLLVWVEKYFKFPEKEKMPFRRKAQPFPSLDKTATAPFRLSNSFTTTGKPVLYRSKGAATAFKQVPPHTQSHQRSQLTWTTALSRSQHSFTVLNGS